MAKREDPGVALLPEWVLVTGQPGCGKTTAVKKIVDLLQRHGLKCKGFYTDEVLDPKKKSRIGFDVVSVPEGKRGVLSRKTGHGLSGNYKTGQYYVDVESFEEIALPSLFTSIDKLPSTETSYSKKQKVDNDEHVSSTGSNDDEDIVLVLDEIGRMELHSTKFSKRVRELLGEQNRLVGAITAPIYGHRVPFCDEVISNKRVEVHKLTKKTRDDVLSELFQLIQDKGWLAG